MHSVYFYELVLKYLYEVKIAAALLARIFLLTISERPASYTDGQLGSQVLVWFCTFCEHSKAFISVGDKVYPNGWYSSAIRQTGRTGCCQTSQDPNVEFCFQRAGGEEAIHIW